MRAREDSGPWPWVIGALVLAAALAAGAYYVFREAYLPKPQKPTIIYEPVTSVTGARVSVKLYFPAKDGERLGLETREVSEQADRAGQARALVGELIRGPVSEELTPSFPPETRLKGMFIDASGTAYLNFSREVQTEYPGGAWTETLTIYSLANTLAANFPDINRVQVLVEGAVVDTLAGHIDISRPFAPRPALNEE